MSSTRSIREKFEALNKAAASSSAAAPTASAARPAATAAANPATTASTQQTKKTDDAPIGSAPPSARAPKFSQFRSQFEQRAQEQQEKQNAPSRRAAGQSGGRVVGRVRSSTVDGSADTSSPVTSATQSSSRGLSGSAGKRAEPRRKEMTLEPVGKPAKSVKARAKKFSASTPNTHSSHAPANSAENDAKAGEVVITKDGRRVRRVPRTQGRSRSQSTVERSRPQDHIPRSTSPPGTTTATPDANNNISTAENDSAPGKRLVKRRVKRTVRRPRPKSTMASPRERAEIDRSLGITRHFADVPTPIVSTPQRGTRSASPDVLRSSPGRHKQALAAAEQASRPLVTEKEVSETAKPRTPQPVATQYAEYKYNGGKYKGESALEGQHPHGMGTIVFEDQSKYNGQWVAGKRHGPGRFEWPSGNRFEGLWANGVRDGLGEEKTSDGNKLVCTWKAGKAHGRGTLTLIDGKVMSVHYENGRLVSCTSQKRK